MGINPETLAAPGNGWKAEDIRDHFSKLYDKTKTDALARPDGAVYPDQWGEFRMVAASNNWWKQWFVDTKPITDHFIKYRGHASFHIGEIDSQCPARRELAFAKSRIGSVPFARAPHLIFHPGRGHSLRTGERVAGPMDDVAKSCLTSEIVGILGDEI